MPPPFLFGGAFVLGWLLNRLVPLAVLPAGVGRPGAFVFGVAALLLAVASFRELSRANTAVSPYKPSAALVRSGPFAYSRNPLYVSLILLTLGLALLVNALWCVVLLVPAVIVLRFGVVAREEAYLLRRFGDEYRCYCAGTRRWI
jgi:protein-S-isoprenylcysteine O-methyltransferase Ste14